MWIKKDEARRIAANLAKLGWMTCASSKRVRSAVDERMLDDRMRRLERNDGYTSAKRVTGIDARNADSNITEKQ
jgi:hypothetical protein